MSLNIYNVLAVVFETRESRARLQFSLGSGGYLDVSTHSRGTEVHASLSVRKDKPEGLETLYYYDKIKHA